MATVGPWICDVCHMEIRDISKCYVVWRYGEAEGYHDFNIIHQRPLCDNRPEYTVSLPVTDFLGPDGLAHLLSFLSEGPVRNLNPGASSPMPLSDPDGFVDFIRRVQTPGYEYARCRYHDSDVRASYAGATEFHPYTQAAIKKLLAAESE